MGAEGRYDDKLMFSPRMSPDHATEVTVRVWGTTFKPALKKECQRLGVIIYDRVMVTSLLTEGGIQGARVIGATGFNNRTGEFMIFKSKAAVLATASSNSLGFLSTELAGYNTFPGSRTRTGDGVAMAWKAGAELTLMEADCAAQDRHRAQAYLVRRRQRRQSRKYPTSRLQRQKTALAFAGMAGRRRYGTFSRN